MKLMFIGGVFAKENFDEITKCSKRQIEYSANLFQEKLIEGFDNSGYDIQIISAPFIGAYPNAYKKWRFRGFNNVQTTYSYVNFCNIWGIRNFSRYRAIRQKLDAFIHLDTPEKVIIVYSVHTPFLQAAVYAKTKDPRIKICLIVLDLPQYMNLDKHKSMIYRIGKAYDVKQFEKYNKHVDSYVLLTEQMTEKLDIHDSQYMVLEGIVRSSELDEVNLPVPRGNVKTILYAGKLNEKFGVKNLVDAFCAIHDPDLRLVVCGKGDLDAYLDKVARKDSRIIYKGVVTPYVVKELVAISNLLVNPRPNNEEYTRYSFPSKNIEYLLSGKPVLGYKLEGMPEVYREFMIIVNDDNTKSTTENLRLAIETALSVDSYDNSSFLQYAKENLLADAVVKKIIELSFGEGKTDF